jgi:hypothetical protein
MFKRGVLVLVVAAMLAVLSGEAAAATRDVTVETHLKHPVVKSVVRDHDNIKVTLQEDPTKAADDSEDEKDNDDDSDSDAKVVNLNVDLRKVLNGKAVAEDDDEDKSAAKHKVKKIDLYAADALRSKTKTKKHLKKDHDSDDDRDSDSGMSSDSDSDSNSDSDSAEEKPTAKPHKHHHHKQVSVTKENDGEIIRKYPHGSVRIQASKHGKKSHKKDDSATPAPSVAKEDTKTTTKDVNLESGESVVLDFGGHTVNLTVAKNGSLIVVADNETTMLPPTDEVDVEIEGAVVVEDGSEKDGQNTPTPAATANVTTAPAVKKEVKSHVNRAAKKFTDLVTTVTGNTVSKDAAPIVFACGLVGALAAIVGVAAVALGRVRHNDAAEDPQSVLADAAVEDVEAGIQTKTEEGAEADAEAEAEDAPAEKSEALSDSDSDSDVEIEEGSFANDKNTASV